MLATIGDVAHPMWRDLGYAVGEVVAGLIAERLGLAASICAVAALTFVSGSVVALCITEIVSPAARRRQPL